MNFWDTELKLFSFYETYKTQESQRNVLSCLKVKLASWANGV